MSKNFLYLKLNNRTFFENSINPQEGHIILYPRLNNGEIELAVIDENGIEQIISKKQQYNSSDNSYTNSDIAELAEQIDLIDDRVSNNELSIASLQNAISGAQEQIDNLLEQVN